MKIWRDANEIGMIHELPNEKLKEIDIEMRKKPNFDKNINKKRKDTGLKKK